MRKIPGVDLPQQRRTPEILFSHVEDKIHQRVELSLREPDRYDLVHAIRRGLSIAGQQRLGLLLRDGLPRMYARRVSVADSPDAALVLIRGQHVALEQLRQPQSLIAVGKVVYAHALLCAAGQRKHTLPKIA